MTIEKELKENARLWKREFSKCRKEIKRLREALEFYSVDTTEKDRDKRHARINELILDGGDKARQALEENESF